MTGRVHTSFNQRVTVTGRLSNSDPNLLNIPIRIPLSEAERYIEHYFAPYSGVKAYQERLLEETRRTGDVTTIMNRSCGIRRNVVHLPASGVPLDSCLAALPHHGVCCLLGRSVKRRIPAHHIKDKTPSRRAYVQWDG